MKPLAYQAKALGTALMASLAIAWLPANAYEVPTNNKEVTLEQIMSDPSWIALSPESVRYGADGVLYFEVPQKGTVVTKVVRYVDGKLETLTDRERANIVFADTNPSDDLPAVTSVAGNIWSYDGALKRLTNTSDRDSSVVNVDQDTALFMRGNRVMSVDIVTGQVSELLQIKLEAAPSEKEDLYTRQQTELFQYVQKLQRSKKQREAHADKLAESSANPQLEPLYLGADKTVTAYSLAPSGRWLAIKYRDKSTKRGRNDDMPHFVTEDGYVYSQKVRPLVGTGDALNDQFMVIDLSTGLVSKELDISKLPQISNDPLATIKRETAKHQGTKYQVSDEARTVSLAGANWGSGRDMMWDPSGTYLLMALKSADNKDRWITLFDTEANALESRFYERDNAWINTFDAREYGWTEREGTFYFISEKSGYAHLYIGTPNTRPVQLTEGEFEVDSITAQGNWLYFTANKTHPGEYEVYRVSLDGGEPEQLTTLGGVNSYVLNPAGDELAITHSTSWQPPELYVQSIGDQPVRLTHTISKDFMGKPWVEPQIVPIESSHADLPIWTKVYVDESVKVEGKRPAVIFVHGAGYTQNSHKGWPYYFREQMFHSMLANKGYVVIDMDYRASEGYGRDWRTAIYRDMGRAELEDFADGINWMVENHNVDPKRVGIYGGSYGGFMTLMAMFKAPDAYAAGAALRPVTDWAHYNHGYTSSILNTPEVDPVAYERSSPIYFAEGLKGKLLIAHGMLDDNVFVKDSVRLTQRLIELRKGGWEAAYYPIEPHGYREPSSWYDQYRRIYELFENTIGENAKK